MLKSCKQIMICSSTMKRLDMGFLYILIDSRTQQISKDENAEILDRDGIALMFKKAQEAGLVLEDGTLEKNQH